MIILLRMSDGRCFEFDEAKDIQEAAERIKNVVKHANGWIRIVSNLRYVWINCNQIVSIEEQITE